MGRRTASDIPLERFYGPSNGSSGDGSRPGVPPFTRGIHPRMYRERLWTMRQFAGYGTPEETNRRFRYLLQQGQTGLSVAFDLPTLMGYDSDHEAAEGEVGKCGVAVSSLADAEELFKGIRLDAVTTSMTITSSAAILWAMYLVVAERQGADWSSLSGTVQNDILKEFIAQKEFIYPPRPSMRLVADSIEFAARHAPRYNAISISGYHIREAGATAVQELAYTLGAAIAYVEWTLERGLAVDRFAPRLSFFFDSHNDFFEEIAKFRAARRVWCSLMRDRFGAREARSLKLRFHAQTAGVTLTAQQPEVNLVRTALQALAAVLGGAQSLHTNALDEAHALPTAQAALLALRTQQVIAAETGVTDAIDPCGGSYFVERLTDELEGRCLQEIARLDAMGGMVAAVERGYPQSEIAKSAYRYQRDLESGATRIVGVNAHQDTQQRPIETLVIDETAARRQRERLREVRRSRDSGAVASSLDAVRRSASGSQNLMPSILDAVRAYATLGEICDVLRAEFGVYDEQPTV